jgi:hypothetical protein
MPRPHRALRQCYLDKMQQMQALNSYFAIESIDWIQPLDADLLIHGSLLITMASPDRKPGCLLRQRYRAATVALTPQSSSIWLLVDPSRPIYLS